MRRSAAALALPLLLVLASAASAQIPRLPRPKVPVKVPESLPGADRMPGLDKLLTQEPPITTSLDDVLPDAPFLDNFAPTQTTPMTELPRGLNGSFYLYPGTYWFEAKSYCLRPAPHGPGGGDAYFYAPLQGPESALVRHILQRSVEPPEIPQRDVQVLLWAIIARTKVSDMSRDRQRTAARLLTPAEILELNGYGLGPLSDAVRAHALTNLPDPVRKVLEAENRLRQMVASAETPFEDIERVAVLAGMAPPDPEGRQATSGRWSYHPGGYFIRFLPREYSRTRIELYVPEQVPVVERDSHGRITSVRDPRTSSIEPGRTGQQRVLASRGPRAGDASEVYLVATLSIRQFDPSDGPAIPGNRNAQRLGMSAGKAGGGGPDAAEKAKDGIKALKTSKRIIEVAGKGPQKAALGWWGNAIPSYLFGKILECSFDWVGEATAAIDMDPPRSDYTIFATPETRTFEPLTPSPDLPPARAAAGNRLMEVSLDLIAKLRAAGLSLDRIGGANQAGDTTWGWRQGAALVYYKREAGAAMLLTADRLDDLVTELRKERVQDIVLSLDAVREYQARLRAEGFSAEELKAARTIKLSDGEIEENRRERITANPARLASSTMSAATEYAAALRNVGKWYASLPAVVVPWSEGTVREQR